MQSGSFSLRSVRQMMSVGSGLLASPRTALKADSCSAKACGVLNSRNGFSTSHTRSPANAEPAPKAPNSDNDANAISFGRMTPPNRGSLRHY